MDDYGIGYLATFSQGKKSTVQCKKESLIQEEGSELISVRDEFSQEVTFNWNDEESNQLMQILEVVPGTIMRKKAT